MNKEITINNRTYKVGDRVEYFHYQGHPPFKGYIDSISKSGNLSIKLDIGGVKETGSPRIRHCS